MLPHDAHFALDTHRIWARWHERHELHDGADEVRRITRCRYSMPLQYGVAQGERGRIRCSGRRASYPFWQGQHPCTPMGEPSRSISKYKCPGEETFTCVGIKCAVCLGQERWGRRISPHLPIPAGADFPGGTPPASRLISAIWRRRPTTRAGFATRAVFRGSGRRRFRGGFHGMAL